jgi:hypothetical protein
MSLRELIYNYVTVYNEGFNQSEIDKLLLQFPNVDKKRFSKILLKRKPIAIGKVTIIRHHDVLKAIIHGIMKPKRGKWKK